MPRKFDFLSPGIEITEVDQSILPAQVDADGPVLIGRFRKGPGMKPAKVRSLDDFVQVYGNPVPGGSSLKGDIWRDGPQLSAPTPAAYAAQAWLASRTSPVNLVRLLGDQHPQATAAGYAGWQISGSSGARVTATATDNSTAYGLFVSDITGLGDTTKGILNITAFDVTALGGQTSGDSAVLSFFHLASLAASPAFTVAGGLAFQINFDQSVTKGSIVKLEDAGGDNASGTGRSQTGGQTGVPVYSIGIDESSDTQTTVMQYIQNAIVQAVSDGVISDIAVDNNGTSLTIHNLSTSKQFNIADKGPAGTHFGGSNPADFDFSANGTSDALNNDYGVELDVATSTLGEGTLAAVFYVNSGYMTLVGTDAHGGTTAATTGNGVSEALIKSSDALTFTAKIYNSAGTLVENIVFNFDRTSGNYIRKKFNTNPQLVNSSITATADQKNYWLGESFERSLKDKVTSTTAAGQVAALIPLHKDDVAATTENGNWGYQRTGSAEAKSGWLIGRNYGANDTTYIAESSVSKLFRFECIHAGEEIQKNVLIAIEDLKLATNPTVYAYGTFTVKIMDVNGGTLEKYSGCNLDPNSPNFISRRIGDM